MVLPRYSPKASPWAGDDYETWPLNFAACEERREGAINHNIFHFPFGIFHFSFCATGTEHTVL